MVTVPLFVTHSPKIHCSRTLHRVGMGHVPTLSSRSWHLCDVLSSHSTARGGSCLRWLCWGRAARSTAQRGGSKMVTCRDQFSLTHTQIFFLPAHTFEKFTGLPHFQSHFSLKPGQKWRQTHLLITKRHLNTMFLVLSACVKHLLLGLSLNVLFTQLSRIMAFESRRKEWIIIRCRSPDPLHLPGKWMYCFPGLLHWYVCEPSIIYIHGQ